MTTVSIRPVFKLIDKRNPISGHEWTEHGPTTGYVVVGACGVYSRHRIWERAEKARKELQAFYDKFGL